MVVFLVVCAAVVVVLIKRSEWNLGETEELLDDGNVWVNKPTWDALSGSDPDSVVWDRNDSSGQSNEELGS